MLVTFGGSVARPTAGSGMMAALVAIAYLCLVRLVIAAGVPQTNKNIRTVTTITELQRALNEGVRHVVLTEHVNAATATAEVEASGESLDTGIGSIQPTTKSVVVRFLPAFCFFVELYAVYGRSCPVSSHTALQHALFTGLEHDSYILMPSPVCLRGTVRPRLKSRG